MWIEETKASEFICPMRGSACAGRECAAWRWGQVIACDQSAPNAVKGSEIDWFKAPNDYFKPRKGFCGMAGKPHI